MARASRNSNVATKKYSSFITLSPPFLHFLPLSPIPSSSSSSSSSSSPLFSPKKIHKQTQTRHPAAFLALFALSLLFSLSLFLAISLLALLRSHHAAAQAHCPSFSATIPPLFTASLAEDGAPSLARSAMVPLPAHSVIVSNLSEAEREFWRQPEEEERDGERYRPCLEFGIGYRRASARVSRERRKFLVVVASGGLNQQRNQIVDAVIIARILEAALVLPILQVNLIWGDESEFSDIFDVEHFKRTLQADVRVVSTIPSTHLFGRQSIESKIPRDVTPRWIHARFFNQLNHDGLLVLKGLDSKLTKNLPPDLQKLKCKVAFHALRFAAPIRVLGDQLAKRMWIEGPYIALHLRLEKDVWVRTGCLTGLGPKYDDVITKVRESQPEFLTGSLNMSHAQRRLAGLCPLNALEMARLLKALGAPRNTRIYNAGGEPFGGSKALQPLIAEFPNLVTKEMLAREGELSPFANKSSALAAIDYIVSLSSDVFVPSHGGNMGRALQGHRAYVGHRKFVKPNKRAMLPFFEDASISEEEFGRIMRELHSKSQGQPELRNYRRDRDVIAYPVPECMCKSNTNMF